jgi:uncharacterized protein YggE
VGHVWAEEQVPAIVVSASGSISREPDRAVVRLAVETVAKTAVDATKENAMKMASILKGLLKANIPKQAVRTISYDLSPRYDQSENRKSNPEPIGYMAHNMVEVVVDEFDKTGMVIDLAIQAGANRVAGVQFEVKDYESAYREALQNAVKAALARAKVIAHASGYVLGKPLEISVSSYHPGPVFKAARAEAMMMSDTSIEGGQIEVVADVTVRYSFGALLPDVPK